MVSSNGVLEVAIVRRSIAVDRKPGRKCCRACNLLRDIGNRIDRRDMDGGSFRVSCGVVVGAIVGSAALRVLLCPRIKLKN